MLNDFMEYKKGILLTKCVMSRGMFRHPIRHISNGSDKVSKLRNLSIELFNLYEIRQMIRQHYGDLNYQSDLRYSTTLFDNTSYRIPKRLHRYL